jgi:integron integrase
LGQALYQEPIENLSHGVKRYILFHDKRHPRDMGEQEIRAFISHLAVAGGVSASTQTVALSALLFLYREVLKRELPFISKIERARKPKRLPTVFTREEVKRILANLEGTHWLIVALLYGSGLRLMECLRLRVKDVDFTYGQLTIRDGKGEQDRITMLPQRLKQPLMSHLQQVRAVHEQDIAAGYGVVFLPYALAQKYPNAAKQWGWQYVFPSTHRSVDPRSGVERRHHVADSTVQEAMKKAMRKARIARKLSHVAAQLRYAFA